MAAKRRQDLGTNMLDQTAKTNTHPAARQAKIALRERVLNAIGPDRSIVFDAFAGDGEMYRGIWHRAAQYVGCDRKWYRDERTAFVADNRRVMRAMSAADLKRFTIFDFDPYGAPWWQVAILIQRRRLDPGEVLGLVLTEGSGISLKMGHISGGLQFLTGVREGVAGGSMAHEELVDMALTQTARRMQARIIKRWQGRGKTGASMRYIAVLLEGIQPE
jgi:hypothetical protein